MMGEFKSKVATELTSRISIKLDEAAGIARAAHGLDSQGLAERAFTTLLDIEPLITDATTLLNAASIIRREADEEG